MSIILLPISIIFAFWIAYEIKKTKRNQEENSNVFWQKEREANFVHPIDLSTLEYIKVPLDQLPFKKSTDETLCEIQDKIKELAEKKIFNLTGLSNTEIKYQYGAANFDKLATYDQNFTLLSRNLFKWGSYLYENGDFSEAQTVLEYAVSCKADISGIYTTLSSIYQKQGNYSKINELKEQAATLNTLMKDSILKSLNQF